MHLALLLALRGTLFLYQGEELGLPQSDVPFEKMVCPAGLSGWPKYKGRDGCRTPFPWTADGPALGFSTTDDTWLPAEPAHALLAVDRQEGDADSTLALTRELLAWRSTHPEVRTGELRFLGAPEPVIAFVRAAGGAASLCVFNRGPEPVRWTPPQAVTSYHAASRGAAFEAGDILLEPYGFLLCRLA
jgi:alpha-glucosidase